MATVEELLKAQNASQNASGATIPNATPTASVAPAPTESENRINAMFDAQKESQLKQLESAYNQSMSAQQAALDKIAPQYQTAANDLAVQYERNRRNFNEQAAMNGINTGAASQAALAQNNEYLRSFGNLRSSEGEAIANANRGMADLTTNYQTNISAAIADNDYKRAAALLDQYQTDRTEALARAEVLASYGDFSQYELLWGKAQADAMKANWASLNPLLAFNMGAITPDQYNNLVSGRPINEGLDQNGNKVVAVISGGGAYSPSASDTLRNQIHSMYYGTNGSNKDISDSGLYQALINSANRF